MSDITLTVSAPGPTVDLAVVAGTSVTLIVSSGGGVSDHASLPDLATSGHPASIIAFTPTGSIAATTVQAAVAEVATDAAAAYQPLDADLTAVAALTAPATSISGAAQKASNLSDLASASSARTNLGLGGAATLAVGTTAGTVAAGDDSRLVAVPADMLGVFSGGGDFVGVPGQGFVTTSTGTLTAGRDYYFPFEVRRALTITFAEIQVTTGPASDATIYVGIYAATNAGQPTGSPLLNTTISCTSGATGIKSVSGLSAALPAGNYVSAINTSVNFVIRTYGSAVGTGFSANLGTGPGLGYVFGTRTAAAFTSSPTAWDNLAFNGALSMGTNSLFFKWSTP